mgnify:CR=1 FL=1|tara:strand:- start:52 stop:330 length:279 start_codon:yes stop_codon:yes gene_type:complete
MKNLTTILNAKEVKAILKAEGVDVISCKMGTGTFSDCVNLVISSKDLSWSMSLMSGLNIVDSRGNEFIKSHYVTSQDYVQFYDCKAINFENN